MFQSARPFIGAVAGRVRWVGHPSSGHAGAFFWPRYGLVGLVWGAYLADGSVDYGEEELSAVLAGLGFDVLAGFAACFLALGEGEVAVAGGDDGELLDDVEVTVFGPAAELPALGDGAGEDLLVGPGVGLGGFVGVRGDGGAGLGLGLGGDRVSGGGGWCGWCGGAACEEEE